MKNKYPGITSKKYVITAIVAALILVVAVGLYFYSSQKKPDYIMTESGKVDVKPPTETDKQDAQDNKDRLEDQPKDDQGSNPSVKKSIAPVIVDAGQYGQSIEVRAFEPEVVENGGTCTMAFNQGSNKVSKEVSAIADASTTRCTNLEVPRTEFVTSGTWDLTVTYTSPTTEGKANTKVTIQ